MPDLHDLFSRAVGDTPSVDTARVRRIVMRRRRRWVVAGALIVAVAVVGSAIIVSHRNANRQVVIAPSRSTTSSSPTPSSVATSTTVPTGTLGYPRVAARPDAFRGFGKLAYQSDGALWILDGTGAPPRSIPLLATLEQARWSPDGAWLAIQTQSGPYSVNGQGDVFVMRADATNLTRVPVAAAGWAWAPTRDVLAVVNQLPAARNGSIALYAAPDFTTPITKPIAAAYPADFIAWSPDGTRLIFKTYTVRTPFVDRLFSVDETNCPPACAGPPRAIPVSVHLDPQSDVGFIFAGWSADGTRLLVWLDVAHSGSVELDGLAVASIPLDGGGQAQLPAMLAKPSWLADVAGTDQAIVAIGNDRVWDSHRQLDTCNLATGTCTPLVNKPGPTIDPAVSPDGQHLAYVATDPVVFANNAEIPPKSSKHWTRTRRLVVAGIANQDPHVIATDGVVAPQWSTDGHHLIFWRAGYLWLVDVNHPAPVAIAGQLEPRPDSFGFGRFEDYAYILPGNDVWDTVAWLQPKT